MTRLRCLKQITAILVLAVTLVGCGTTQIISNDPQARIVVDGVPMGQGIARVTKVGFPGSSQIIAETNDGRKMHQTISRSFAWTTALFGFFTYGICFFACWEYPETVFLTLPMPSAAPSEAPPDGTADPWLLPPTNWKD